MSPLFHFDQADLGYPSHLVLRDLSFGVNERDFIGIVGPNGAGKSTLVKTMLGLLPLCAGRMEWPGGRPIIGYVPQREQIDPIWPMRVRDMLQFTLTALEPPHWRRRGEHARVAEVMHTTEIDMLADQTLDTLSGGEMQRLLLARALIVEPQVLLLDEPTAAMDLFATERFMSVISRLHSERDVTIILVTHDLQSLAGRASTVGILSHGTLHHGPTSRMLSAERLSDVYGHPVHVHRQEDQLFIAMQGLENGGQR